MSGAPKIPAHLNVNATLGALEVGVLVSVFLFGMVTVQTYSYYRKFPRDMDWIKILVSSPVSISVPRS